MGKIIDIVELRQISDLIFDHILNELEVRSIELSKELYWTISSKDLYDIEKDPNNFGVGQLSDDIDFLLKILDDKNQAVPPMLMHLAPILSYLSTQVNWYDDQNRNR